MEWDVSYFKKTDLTSRRDRATSERDLGVILCLNSVWILNDVQLVHMLNTMVNSSRLNPECTWVCTLNGWHTTIECNWLTSYSYVEFNSEFKPYTLFICVPICTVCAYMLTIMVSSSVWSTCMLCISRWYVFDSRCWLWLNHHNRSIKYYWDIAWMETYLDQYAS